MSVYTGPEMDPDSGAPSPTSAPAGNWYQRNIAPLADAAAKGMAFASGAPMADKSGQIVPSGAERFAAGNIIAPTATDELLNILFMLMPGGEEARGGLRGLGEAKQVPWLFKKGLLPATARIGTQAGIGAGIGALTGEGAEKGAKKAAYGAAGGEFGSAALRRIVEGNKAARYTAQLGRSIKSNYPAVSNALEMTGNKLDSPEAFDRAFKSGELMNRMNHFLGETKDQVQIAVGPRALLATRPVLTPQGAMLRPSKEWISLLHDNAREAQELGIGTTANFRQADQLITRARVKAYRLQSGVGKDSALGARIRRNSDAVLEQLQNRINAHAPGMGDIYRQGQGYWAEANDLSRMFSEPGVLEGGVVDAPKLQDLAKERGGKGYRDELERTPQGKKLLNDMFRGSAPIATDKPRMGVSLYGELWPFPIHLRTHVNPFGTSRVGREPVDLYHGIPSVVAKSIEEGQLGLGQ